MFARPLQAEGSGERAHGTARGNTGGRALPMKKSVLAVLLLGCVVTMSGCFTLSWKHNRRHLRKFIDELIELHQDVDKVIFGLDKDPSE